MQIWFSDEFQYSLKNGQDDTKLLLLKYHEYHEIDYKSGSFKINF